MRVDAKRRRRWNNWIIMGVIAFMVILNAPTLIKTYLLDPEESTSPYPHLLNPNLDLREMHFSDWSLTQDPQNDAQWTLSIPSHISPEQLAERWVQLFGSELDEATYQDLKAVLPPPETIEVWYRQQEEPQRITLYRYSKFWVFKNWQEKWIAISVDSSYLLPQ